MTDHDIGGEFWFNSGQPNSFSASTVYPARYTNRLVFELQQQYSLDGDYYLRLMAPLTDKPSSEGYLLTVAISGEVEPGPVYQVGDGVPARHRRAAPRSSTVASSQPPAVAATWTPSPAVAR